MTPVSSRVISVVAYSLARFYRADIIFDLGFRRKSTFCGGPRELITQKRAKPWSLTRSYVRLCDVLSLCYVRQFQRGHWNLRVAMATEQQIQNVSNESKPSVIGTLPEALFVAGLTALAYWLAFLYQVSYLHFFDLPPDLAEVSLQSILLVVLALAALSIFFWSLNLVPIFLSDDPSRQRFIFPFAVLPLLGSAWVYYFGLQAKGSGPLLAF